MMLFIFLGYSFIISFSAFRGEAMGSVFPSHRERAGLHGDISKFKFGDRFENKGFFSLKPAIKGCRSSPDCKISVAASLACKAGECIPKTLGAKCSSSSECSMFTTCESGKCVYGGLSKSCAVASNCIPRFTCIAGKCAEGSAGANCLSGLNCAVRHACDKDKKVCVLGIEGKFCNEQLNCDNGLECSSNTMTCSKGNSAKDVVDEVLDTAKKLACIGLSSSVEGTPIKDLVLRNTKLRLQRHPIRTFLGLSFQKVSMLCLKTKNTKFCATERHIVQHSGSLMSMAAYCKKTKNCFEEADIPFSFKGACGEHLDITRDLKVTQHVLTEGATPIESSQDECRSIFKNYAHWLLSTL